MSGKRRRLMPAEHLQRIAYELVAIAPGAPWMLRRAAGLPLDSASGQPLGLESQPPTAPEGSPMNDTEARACGRTQIETLGFQHCVKPKGHAGLHRSQDGHEYDGSHYVATTAVTKRTKVFTQRQPAEYFAGSAGVVLFVEGDVEAATPKAHEHTGFEAGAL